MQSRDRQHRRQAVTRAALLDAAVAIAKQEGWSSVTLRKIAERIEYTHAAMYTYFATKDDLLLALLRQGFLALRLALDTARAGGTIPLDAFREVVLAYWNFAWDHPEMYQVMYGLDGIAFGTTQTRTEGQAIGDAVAAALQPLLALSEHTSSDLSRQVVQLWSAMHGLIALVMADRIPGGRVETQALALLTVQDLLHGWGLVVLLIPQGTEERTQI